MYTIQKYYQKLMSGQATFFLDPLQQKQLLYQLKKVNYQIFYPYPDSEKVIFYTSSKPEVLLYQIKTKQELKHQDILGSIFSLNISGEMFGDIIIQDGKYYIYILASLQNYFESNFTRIKNTTISLELISCDFFADFQREYLEEEIIVSSERIDSVIAQTIHTNRESVKSKIQKKEIMMNHDILTSCSYILKPGDIFSIRRYGKYRYGGIIKKTKKNHFLVHISKYL